MQKTCVSCHCGQVQVLVKSVFSKLINCHCGQCRRLSGAAFTTWVTTQLQGCEFPANGSYARYEASAHCRRHFCRQCGTHVFTLDKRMPAHVGFPAGAVLDVPLEPVAAEYFVDHRASWCSAIEAGAKQLGGVTGDEPAHL